MTTVLHLESLSVVIGGKQVTSGLDLQIGRGERWAILGINGVGKTTLLHTLAGLRPPHSGSVRLSAAPQIPQGLPALIGSGETAPNPTATRLNQLPARERARRIGLMSQDDDFAAETRVLDAVLLGRLPHLHWWRGESAHDIQIAREALLKVGLDASFESRLASTLSGGERRRVALASLLAQSVGLMMLDEPTTHLDLHQQIALLDLLASFRDHTLVMSLHDVNLAARFCTHALLLFGDGQCCGGPISAMLDAATLSRLYHHRIDSIEGPTGTVFLPG